MFVKDNLRFSQTFSHHMMNEDWEEDIKNIQTNFESLGCKNVSIERNKMENMITISYEVEETEKNLVIELFLGQYTYCDFVSKEDAYKYKKE